MPVDQKERFLGPRTVVREVHFFSTASDSIDTCADNPWRERCEALRGSGGWNAFEQFGGKLPLGRHALNVDERRCPRDNDRLLERADAQHGIHCRRKGSRQSNPIAFTDVNPGSENVTA